jgi:Family of unknown function (DUF6325)
MGPVQVLIVGIDQPRFSGEVLAEFARLREAGIVRLLDLLLVERAEDGSFDTLAAPAELGPESGALAATLLGDAAGGAGEASQAAVDASLWSLSAAVPPGSAAAVAFIEHLWASPLLGAIQRAGGTPLDETWLAGDDLAMLEKLIATHKA